MCFKDIFLYQNYPMFELGSKLGSKLGSFCKYRKALCFWSLGISLYLELFCFQSLFLLFYVICAPLPAEAAQNCVCSANMRSVLIKSRCVYLTDKIRPKMHSLSMTACPNMCTD